jgi:hypothetical protein
MELKVIGKEKKRKDEKGKKYPVEKREMYEKRMFRTAGGCSLGLGQ